MAGANLCSSRKSQNSVAQRSSGCGKFADKLVIRTMPARYQPADKRARSSLLRAARISREMTQRELAEESGLSQVAITKVETGRINPRRSTKKILALSLDYEVSDIFPVGEKKSTSKKLRALLKKEEAR